MKSLPVFLEKANRFKQYGFSVFANDNNGEVILTKRNYARIIGYTTILIGSLFTTKAFYDLAVKGFMFLSVVQIQIMFGLLLLLSGWIIYRSRKQLMIRISLRLKKLFIKRVSDDTIDEMEIDINESNGIEVDSIGEEFEFTMKDKKQGLVRNLFRIRKRKNQMKEYDELKEVVSDINSMSL